MTGLRFTKTHEWLRLEGDVAIVGITDYAQQLLGDMVYVDCPIVGRELTQGEEMGVVESVKAASDIYAPASGTVLEVNQAVLDNPGLVNNAAEEAGWLIKLKLQNPKEVENLLDTAQYEQEIHQEHS
ncbi:MAG: glycine cleavage system protein GcvH [Legionella sp.]|nr:glycine cleavage system protein GcvH [Legionella sp.]